MASRPALPKTRTRLGFQEPTARRRTAMPKQIINANGERWWMEL